MRFAIGGERAMRLGSKLTNFQLARDQVVLRETEVNSRAIRRKGIDFVAVFFSFELGGITGSHTYELYQQLHTYRLFLKVQATDKIHIEDRNHGLA